MKHQESVLNKENVLKAVHFEVEELKEISATRKGKFIPIPNRKAIYRPDKEEVIALLSSEYQLLTHGKAVDIVFKGLDQEKIKYEPVKLELPRGGNKLFLHLRSPEIYTIGDHGDEVQMETIVTNSYDRSTPFGLELGGYRKICSNGMRAWRKDFAVIRKHFTFDPQEMVQQFMMQVKRFREDLLPMLQAFQELKISKKAGFELISSLVIAKKYQKAMTITWEQSQEDRNLWQLYNAMTYITTHVIKSYLVQRKMELRAFNIVRNRLIGKK